LAERFTAPVEQTRITDVRFSPRPKQGHHPIEEQTVETTTVERSFPPGTYWVACDQPGGILAVHLLEAQSPQSFLHWNAFDSIFERGLVVDDAALEEIAWRMLADEETRTAYTAALADSAFASDPEAKLDFFYRRTPHADPGENVYPVYRLLTSPPPALTP
jgi:hypothetical protein